MCLLILRSGNSSNVESLKRSFHLPLVYNFDTNSKIRERVDSLRMNGQFWVEIIRVGGFEEG